MEMNKTLQKIKDLMEERGWTMYRLAQESNIAYSSLNSLFHKNNQPTISSLEKICDGFQMTLAEFFSDEASVYQDFRCSKEEQEIVEMMRQLTAPKRDRLTYYIKGYCQEVIVNDSEG